MFKFRLNFQCNILFHVYYKTIILIQYVNSIKTSKFKYNQVQSGFLSFLQDVALLASYITLSPVIIEHTYNCWKYY